MVGGAIDGRRWRHAEDRSGQEGTRRGRYVHAHDGLLLWGFVAHGGGVRGVIDGRSGEKRGDGRWE